MKGQWHRGTAAPARTAGLRSIARAFFLSLSVHAALVAVLCYLISTSLQPTPREQRVEVDLAPRQDAGSASASARAPVEAVANAPTAKHAEARTDQIAHAPTGTVQTNPHFVAPAEPNTHSPSAADATPSPAEEESARPAQAQATPAIDLRVLDWLARYRTYPLAARRARLEGVVQLRVTLMPDGRFVDARVERSSGHVLLDQAALDLLARAAPLPADFADERSGQIDLQLPIVYRMRAPSS